MNATPTPAATETQTNQTSSETRDTSTETVTPPNTTEVAGEEKSCAETLLGDKTPQAEEAPAAAEDESTSAPDAVKLGDLTLPEGFDTNDPAAAEFISLLNDPEISKKDFADRLLGMYAEQATKMAEANNALWLETNQRWQDELTATFGEQTLTANLHEVGSMIESFDRDSKLAFRGQGDRPEFGKELRDAFDLTGAGNNPAIVKFLFWASKQLGEGKPLSGQPAGGEVSRAQKLFG